MPVPTGLRGSLASRAPPERMPQLRDPITSRSNPLVKRIRQAAGRGLPTGDGFALAESPQLLTEALRSGIEIDRVLVSATAQARLVESLAPHHDFPLHPVADRLFQELATTAHSQGVLALVKLPSWDPDRVFSGLVLALDAVRDPGNAGTCVRSAEAFGAAGIVFLKGSAAPTNPKTLRASAGSLFRVPFLAGIDPEAFIALAKEGGRSLVAAEARGGVPLHRAELPENSVVIIGSETHGISPALLADAAPVAVPTAGVESLNAAVAAAVILYERARRLAVR